MASLKMIRDKAIKINDDIWGERVELSFFVKGLVDKERRTMIAIGVLRTTEEQVKKADGGVSTGWKVPIAAVPAKLSIDPRIYPSLVVKRGDKVKALSRVGQPSFVVTSVDDRSHHRLYIYLGEA